MLQSIDHDSQQSSRLPANVSEDARRRITEALDHSLAPTTRANYRAQWKRWVTFATENDYPVFPSDPVHVADWITQRAADGRKPGTIRMGLAAVSAAHRHVNLPSPAEDAGVRAAMRGITRIAGRAQKQAAGLTAASLPRSAQRHVFLEPGVADLLRVRQLRRPEDLRTSRLPRS